MNFSNSCRLLLLLKNLGGSLLTGLEANHSVALILNFSSVNLIFHLDYLNMQKIIQVIKILMLKKILFIIIPFLIILSCAQSDTSTPPPKSEAKKINKPKKKFGSGGRI